uniref:Uncharacterized protein n=1 Tax=Acanthochromis polyacanthus TaxID=80966 RepID=A0A3Q1EQY8_9TELE
MFSFAGSICLLVLMGVVLAIKRGLKHDIFWTHLNFFFFFWVTLVRFINIKSVNNNKMFFFHQRGENLQLMNATLDVYIRIFSSILQNQNQQQHHGTGSSALLGQLPDGRRSEVEAALMKLQQKMENLKNHMNPRIHNRDEVLNRLNKIRVDDPMVQKKALAEFAEVFQTASVIGSRMC